MPTWAQLLLRRKVLDTTPSTLPRKLTLIDLTLLGMGATLGAGAYVLVGSIARNMAGPAIVLSFIISGFASILSALCYAEFGARVPRAGSAYVYSYVTVGEVFAWTTGWQLLLEYVIGASAVAVAWSSNVDSIAGGAISTWFAQHMSWSVPGFASHPDFLAFAMTMVLTGVCALGVKESTTFNNVLSAVNIAVMLFVVIAGAFFASGANWSTFAPFGMGGVFSGAATSFFSYVGFDVICTSAEEAINPSVNVPLSIVLALSGCMAIYIGVSTVITLMVPYTAISVATPLISAFPAHAVWAARIVQVGSVCALTACLMVSVFPMPRIIYAIASDGLLPEWIGRVHPRFNTPVRATIVSGLLAALLSMVFDLTALADMLSVGTLIAYTLVAASVLALRYREYDDARSGRLLADRAARAAAMATTEAVAAAVKPGDAAPATLLHMSIDYGDGGRAVGSASPDARAMRGRLRPGIFRVDDGEQRGQLLEDSASDDDAEVSGGGQGGGSVAAAAPSPAAVDVATPPPAPAAPGAGKKRGSGDALAGIAAAVAGGVTVLGGSPRRASEDHPLIAPSSANGQHTTGLLAGASGVPAPAADVVPRHGGSVASEAMTASAISVGSALHVVAKPAAGAVPPRFLLLPQISRSGAVNLWGQRQASYTAAGKALALFIAFTLVAWSVLAAAQSFSLLGSAASTGSNVSVGLTIGVMLSGALYCAIIIALLPRLEPENLPFRAPAAPYLPLISIAVNLYLLVSLSPLTWVRFGVWCVVGAAIYLGYGMRHSLAPLRQPPRSMLEPVAPSIVPATAPGGEAVTAARE